MFLFPPKFPIYIWYMLPLYLISFYSIVGSKSHRLLIFVSTNQIFVKDGALMFYIYLK